MLPSLQRPPQALRLSIVTSTISRQITKGNGQAKPHVRSSHGAVCSSHLPLHSAYSSQHNPNPCVPSNLGTLCYMAVLAPDLTWFDISGSLLYFLFLCLPIYLNRSDPMALFIPRRSLWLVPWSVVQGQSPNFALPRWAHRHWRPWQWRTAVRRRGRITQRSD
jgi:hypothetical protein